MKDGLHVMPSYPFLSDVAPVNSRPCFAQHRSIHFCATIHRSSLSIRENSEPAPSISLRIGTRRHISINVTGRNSLGQVQRFEALKVFYYTSTIHHHYHHHHPYSIHTSIHLLPGTSTILSVAASIIFTIQNLCVPDDPNTTFPAPSQTPRSIPLRSAPSSDRLHQHNFLRICSCN